MIDHIWSVLCRKSMIDSESNNISLLDVVEQVAVEISPGQEIPPEGGVIVPYEFELVSMWARSDYERSAEGEARIQFTTARGATPIRQVFRVDVTEHVRFRTRNRLSGMPIDEEGTYFFTVELRLADDEEWAEVASVPLQVFLRDQPPAEAVAPPEIQPAELEDEIRSADGPDGQFP